MYDELTEQDIKKMEEEIEYRKLVVRKNALEAVKEARAHGDLSENFEYHAAKKDKNQNESRIRYLERMIKTAKVISENSAVDEVGINNTVTVERDSKICRASVQAAKATDTALAPISVSVRTRFATEKDFWNMRSSSLAFI